MESREENGRSLSWNRLPFECSDSEALARKLELKLEVDEPGAP